ncbi:ATP-binding protein [Thiothrix sp.]|jgi:predicted AAA+ superfamily ATPase|uniref:ATP-binding protein n=1 Tax=Thiothrix sp. TaxID=1032 RepID=UPI00257B298F|nr:ATP-binding protein [Thiothrix sp.]
MTTETIKAILTEQNPHWQGEHYTAVPRERLSTLIDYLPLRQIITISGIRRCGKSVLAKQGIQHLLEQGVHPTNILFLNLEQPWFIEYRYNAAYLNTLYDTYLQLANPQGKVYVFLDEVQFFQNWQVFVKSKYETGNIKFILTGSNSSLLSNDLNTLLSGRSLNIHLDTFSFSEYLRYLEIPHQDELSRTQQRIAILQAFDNYLQWGGFFEVFTAPTPAIRQAILLSYAQNILYQDIVPRHQIRNAATLERLFFYLMTNATREINYTTLSQTFGISDKTLRDYLDYFEETFLVKRLERFHHKPKERIKSQKKLYALDNGFLQTATKPTRNLGQALENMVFIELNRRAPSLSYVRDTYEVDFFDGQTLYQVSYSLEDAKTRQREIHALEHFGAQLHKPGLILVADPLSHTDELPVNTVATWLLRQDSPL